MPFFFTQNCPAIDKQGQDWTLTWTPENMLPTAVNDTHFATMVYDADGRMVLTWTPNNRLPTAVP